MTDNQSQTADRGGLSQDELDALVASSDTGGRGSTGTVGIFLTAVALSWSLFQLWIASPIPFIVGWGVFNHTQCDQRNPPCGGAVLGGDHEQIG